MLRKGPLTESRRMEIGRFRQWSDSCSLDKRLVIAAGCSIHVPFTAVSTGTQDLLFHSLVTRQGF